MKIEEPVLIPLFEEKINTTIDLDADPPPYKDWKNKTQKKNYPQSEIAFQGHKKKIHV